MVTEGNPDVDGSERQLVPSAGQVAMVMDAVARAMGGGSYDVWGPLFEADVRERLTKLGIVRVLPGQRVRSRVEDRRVAWVVGMARDVAERARGGTYTGIHHPEYEARLREAWAEDDACEHADPDNSGQCIHCGMTVEEIAAQDDAHHEG